MRAVLQRVTQASVAVDGAVISSVGKGLCVLVGITRDDTPDDMEYIIRKILNTRLWEDKDGEAWKTSVKVASLEILCVSQFTLYGTVTKGNKPDFHQAMNAAGSRDFYHTFLDKLKEAYNADKIKDGQFQAMMQVNLTNDGPVTLVIDSRIRK
ncbi:D-tyrosyl-tRNA(Tyr) deacylase [Allomyces macrogynus ATCC 38327]|uniref:D-aminoacyl-tRNA deacylase n=1 Tax=Allomyces macrogynus (strain ATCC 38327) TaxID=578462 RepID=A0A0L0SA11_ALLM3|nr:D-tyrosyl-tRNA(Tyr) deacylase [Allomyces macrogynus ATCC 38327]|eukprot:KNE59225.1 D-tyrosyl-tRNA(Tyr) deacylase [Allomyces macrogynus ATCC 38327]